MAKTRNSRGQFGREEDFAPELSMERYLNVKKIVVQFGANSALPAFTQFDTGLLIENVGDQGALGGLKWVVFGCTVQPLDGPASPGAWGGGNTLTAQLLEGQQAAMMDVDDDHVLATARIGRVMNTNGASFASWVFPLDIMSPGPMLNRSYTCAMITEVNDAAFQSEAWVFKLLYGVAPLHASDSAALMQQRLLA